MHQNVFVMTDKASRTEVATAFNLVMFIIHLPNKLIGCTDQPVTPLPLKLGPKRDYCAVSLPKLVLPRESMLTALKNRIATKIDYWRSMYSPALLNAHQLLIKWPELYTAQTLVELKF